MAFGRRRQPTLERMIVNAFRITKDHFIPHAGNNHLPHLIRHRALFGYSTIIVALKALTVIATISLPTYSAFSSAITPTNIISLTNASREALGLSDLSQNAVLSFAAQSKANDMLKNQYFAHTSPDGVTPWYWFGYAGYQYKYAGENLAVYFTSAEDVHDGWMASPTHRANIVSDRYSEIGVGVAEGEYDGFPAIFVAELFGHPLDSQPAAVASAATTDTPTTDPSTDVVSSPPDTTNDPQTAPAEEPTIIPETVTVTPAVMQDAYIVSLEAPQADSVTAHLATESVALDKQDDGTFYGVIPYDVEALDKNGTELNAVVNGVDSTTQETLAVVSPQADPQDIYAFGTTEAPKTKLFGFTLKNLNDGVTMFYVYTLVFLGGMLLLTILVKIEKQHPTVVAHVVIVIILTGVMILA